MYSLVHIDDLLYNTFEKKSLINDTYFFF